MHKPREVEELHTLNQKTMMSNIQPLCMWTTHLVYFCSKALLELLLGFLQGLVLLHHIQMGQNAHHTWKSMNLQNVQKLKCLHFKAKAGIYQ